MVVAGHFVWSRDLCFGHDEMCFGGIVADERGGLQCGFSVEGHGERFGGGVGAEDGGCQANVETIERGMKTMGCYCAFHWKATRLVKCNGDNSGWSGLHNSVWVQSGVISLSL